jgi:hypothetical protein
MAFLQEWLRKWYFIPLLVFVSALAYLPNISHFGYFRDDWYLMYSANALGVKTFEGIFAVDRPVRTILMTWLYSVFGMNPLYYNIAAYILRVFGAFAFLWTLRLLWPHQRTATTLAALFFLIYPGFLSTPNAIDYQEKYVGLLLGHLSIALSIKAVLVAKNTHKILLWFPAVLFGGIYPTFVEYYLGLEVFRLLAIGLLVTRQTGVDMLGSIKATLYRWLPFSLSPLGFIIWRFFIFESDRKATDLGAQLKLLVDSPLLVGVGWTISLLKNSLEVVLFSWGFPLVNLWDIHLRLREMIYAGILVSLTMLSIALFLKFREDGDASEAGNANWRKEALWIGLICAVTGFLPVIISNREADFYNYSRYMLPSSSGAVIVLVAVFDQFSARKLRNAIVCLLVGFATLTHHFNGLESARSSKGMQDFWWQVSWRVPQLQAGSTLVLNYSHSAIEEDYFIWGPANLIYHPQSTDVAALRPAISGLVLHPASVASILVGSEPDVIDRRSIRTVVDYGNILVLSQPTLDSCVQVIDGRFPFVSEYEQYDIQQIAGKSNLGNVITDEKSAVPMQMVFGAEPEHGWCYYYQSAALALQRGDLQTVLTLKQEAQKNGYAPADPVEWSPFLQAATLLGDHEEILEMARPVKKSLFLETQACEMLTSMPDVSEETRVLIQKTFCVVK